ncbi:MAG: molybdenum cofactor guanylyltransferase [Dehalococcoidales bacterium]|nr:molybdenum cofactor guanylyltransferase [Dehalococcoidales bacterium]
MEVTGIILAGGKSLRFGRNKALEKIGGVPLIERAVESLSHIAGQIIIVKDKGNRSFASIKNVEFANDVYPDKGPLGGIYTGLYYSGNAVNIVVACDMPFLNTPLLEHMTKILPSYDAIVPRWPGGQIEPLHAVYSLSCLPAIKKYLEGNQVSITACLKKLHVLHLNKRGFGSFDPDFLTFFSIDTQADLDLAVKIMAKKEAIEHKI